VAQTGDAGRILRAITRGMFGLAQSNGGQAEARVFNVGVVAF
jgi:hypothetical protein